MATPVPDLNELHYFVAVAGTRSFTGAASRLQVPKSTISRAVRRLEQRLGVKLLERTTRRVALTEIGELYLNGCRRVMEEAEQADLAVGALLAEPRGLLRVGVPIPFARFMAGPILADFLARYPRMQVHLQMTEDEGVLRQGGLDLIIRGGALGDSGLLVKPILEIRPWVVASPVYLAGRAAPATPAELTRHCCITTSCDTAGGEATSLSTWRLRRGGETAEVQVEARVTVPDPEMNRQLALAGVGVTMLSRSMVRGDLEAGRLVHLLPEWEPEPVQVRALYPTRLGSSPKVRAFLEFLRERGEIAAVHG